MRKALWIVVAVLAVALLPQGAAIASISTGDTITMQASNSVAVLPPGTLAGLITDHTSDFLWGDGAGGEFLINDTTSGSKFLSFCVERSETFVPGSSYKVILSDRAVNGGVGPAGDPLDAATKWLFQQYATSQLDTASGGAFAYNHNASANALQDAIWKLEGEVGSVAGLAATLVALANANAGSYDQATGGVMVAQMWDSVALVGGEWVGTGYHQDQIIMVPEAASIVVWSLLGLSVVGAARRRRAAR